MRDLETLRELAGSVSAPSFDSLVATARRRERRVAALVATTFTVLAVIVAGGLLVDGTSRSAPPVNEPRPSEPTYSPQPGQVLTLPGDVDSAFLAEGRYAVSLDPDQVYELDVPADWVAIDGRYLLPAGGGPVFVASLAAADATTVPTHPCRDQTPRLVGPTVRDLATALRGQPGLRVSRATPVEVGDAEGLYLEVRTPAHLDYSSCADGAVSLFTSGADHWAWDEPTTVRLWIVDEGGSRVTFMSPCAAEDECTADQLRAATAMAESVSFAPAE